MAQNIVELGFNVESFSAEQKQVLKAMQEVFDKWQQMNVIMGKPIPADGLVSFAEQQKQTKIIVDQMTGATTNLTKAQIEHSNALKAAAQAEAAQQKAQQETLKTSNLKEKQLKQEARAAADAANEYKKLSDASREADLKYKNLKIQSDKTGSSTDIEATKAALKESQELKSYLLALDAATGNYSRNVGNYSSALTGYANTLRGLRGPTKLLGEALGLGAQEADQLRLVIEHSLQGLAAWFKGQNAAKEATVTNTAATVEFTTVEGQATAATALNTEAETAKAEATVLSTEATEEATAATGLFIGVIAPFVAILSAAAIPVMFLIDAIKSWVNANEDAMKAEKALAESLEKNIGLEKEAVSIIKEKNELLNKGLKDDIANANAAGVNKQQTLELEQRLAKSQLESAEAIKLKYGVTTETVNKALKEEQDALLVQQGFQRRIDEANRIERENAGKTVLERQSHEDIEKLTAMAATAESAHKLAKTNLDFQKNILDDSDKAQQDATAKGIEIEKLAAETKAKVEAEHNQQIYELRKAHNDRILNDERSTYKQKQDALLGNLNAELRLLDTQVKAQSELRKRDIIDKEEYEASIKAINVKRTQAINAESEALRKMKVQETNDIRAAVLSKEKAELQGEIDTNDAITKNVEKELEARLNAYADSVTEKTTLINKDFDAQKLHEQENGNMKEKLDAIEANRKLSLVKLTANSEKEVYDITKSYLDKKAKAIEEANKATSNSGNTEQYQADTIRLNESLKNNLISYNEYLRQKKALDEGYAISTDEAQVNDDAKKLADLEAFGEELSLRKLTAKQSELKAIEDEETLNNAKILNGKEKLAADEVKLSNEKMRKELEGRKKLAEAEKQIETQIVNFVKTAVDASFQKKEDAIQKQIEITNQLYDNEIAAVQRSSLSQQDKAALEIQLQAQKQQSDREAAREERKLKHDKAKMDKEISIAQITMATGVAIMNALKDFPGPVGIALAAAEGALGAIQLATVIATPLPSYAEGTNYHKGGLARFGEAGAELIVEPNKKPWIAYAETISYLPQGTKVIPMSANIKEQGKSDGLGWEQVKYLGMMIKKNKPNINNVVNTPPPVMNIDFDVYYNQKLKGYN